MRGAGRRRGIPSREESQYSQSFHTMKIRESTGTLWANWLVLGILDNKLKLRGGGGVRVNL